MPRTSPEPAPDHPVLPDHLVDRPTARGWRRLGIGTAPFNVLAMCVLLGMSAVVMATPSDRPGSLSTRERAAAVRDEDAPEIEDAATTTTAVPVDGPAATPVDATSPTSPTRPSTSSKRSTSTTTSTTALPTPSTIPTTTQRAMRCDDFVRQPDAQAAFDLDRTGRAQLDGDGDGVACEQLPGRATTPAPIRKPVRVPSANDLLRPSTRLFGVHTPNAPYSESELTQFESLAGKSPNVLMFFQNLSQPYPTDAIERSWARGALPMVSFEPIIQGSTTGQPTLRQIADGAHDEFFRQWAAEAAAQALPIVFRFAQEMNGNWYSWSDGRMGNAAGEYIEAWRHLHDIFVAAGATNVLWVWSVNRVDNLSDRTLSRVYPGDDYVDWVGVSGYLRTLPDGAAPTFDYTFAATLAELTRVAPSKLVLLTEVGAGTTEENRVSWIRNFFARMLDHPEIIGFSWFNDFKDGGDWRIGYSSATAAEFAAGVADVRFGSF